MNLVIYTYGHIDAMFYVINNIAMIMNSDFANMLIKTTSFMVALFHALRAAYASSSGNAKHHLIKIAGMIIAINSLLIPKTNMMIIDHISKRKETVSNVPYGFAVPVGFLENFGHIITTSFEQAFTIVGNFDYQNYGMVFGARLVKEARNWRITNPEFTFNMNSFIKSCVIRDIAMGYKYSMNDIFLSDNIWKIVSSKSSPLKRAEVKRNGRTILMKCKEVANEIIEPAFSSEIDRIKILNKNTIFSKANPPGFVGKEKPDLDRIFRDNINIVFGEYFGSTNNANENIKQYMMMNSLSDYVRTYGYARSAITQENNWRIAGDLANIYLPLLLSVFKGMIYASFIFMAPIILFGNGMSKYLSYIAILCSLQLWPALNSVLNMFIDLYSGSGLQEIAEGSINYTNYSKIGDYSDKIVAVASGLQMIVPYLAFSIVQGGVSGFIHLANSITSATNNATSIAASEISSGNKSLDNVSIGNQQYAMNHGFKTDMNRSFRSGASEFQHNDGSIEKSFKYGNTAIQSGLGINISSGSKRLNMRKMLTNSLSEDFGETKHKLESSQVMYRDASYDTINKVSSLLGQIAHRESQGENFDYSMFGEEGESLQNFSNQTQTISRQKRIGYEDAASFLLKSYIGAGMNLPLMNLGIGGDLSYSKTKITGDYQSQDEAKTNETSQRKEYNNAVKAMMNEQFSESNNIELSYSDDIRRSYERQKTIEEHMSLQTEKLKRYSNAHSRAESLDSFQESEMFHELEDRIKTEYGTSNLQAHRMIENDEPQAKEIWQQMVSDFTENQSEKNMQKDFDEANLNQEIAEFKSKYNDLIKHNDSKLIDKIVGNQDLGKEVKDKVKNIFHKTNSSIDNK